ncbi:hypothetical protein [Anaeromyxobacter oryzae]|uniref:Metallothionein n=1 Tax=Anaeromyxobacter oryzae TaxID=2918170 RepID=A0ABM7WRA9_9BACT|nr:hypothetical protein [Anaeromyxobacter oryzae]BDG01996.1 hypothetical protein AMOR_09920 [Anaeromyxobacter oryzae]
MTKFLFAAFAAVSFLAAQPVFACEDCKNCPHHKVADADKKPADKAACACAGAGKECKCGEKCACPHCSAQKAGAKKEEPKKT